MSCPCRIKPRCGLQGSLCFDMPAFKRFFSFLEHNETHTKKSNSIKTQRIIILFQFKTPLHHFVKNLTDVLKMHLENLARKEFSVLENLKVWFQLEE